MKRILQLIIIFTIIQPVFASSFMISKESEIDIGKNADKEVLKYFELYKDKALQGYVSGVGQRVVKSISDPIFKYYFKVVNSSDINAFALPGGYIYITTGMLSMLNNEAELAAVLGHEIGHVTSHHGVKQQTKQTAAMLAMFGGLAASSTIRNNSYQWMVLSSELFKQILLGYGREAELQADALGLVYQHNAGYDPKIFLKFLKNLKIMEMLEGNGYHGFYATHPETQERIIKAEDIASSLYERGGKLEKGIEEYLNAIKGVPFGGPRSKEDIGKEVEYYIGTYIVKPKDTFRSIAENVLKDKSLSFKLAVINGKKETTPLLPGESIKVLINKFN